MRRLFGTHLRYHRLHRRWLRTGRAIKAIAAAHGLFHWYGWYGSRYDRRFRLHWRGRLRLLDHWRLFRRGRTCACHAARTRGRCRGWRFRCFTLCRWFGARGLRALCRAGRAAGARWSLFGRWLGSGALLDRLLRRIVGLCGFCSAAAFCAGRRTRAICYLVICRCRGCLCGFRSAAASGRGRGGSVFGFLRCSSILAP